MQQLFGILIIPVLLLLAGYFGWRQVQTLRWLKTQEQMPPEDRVYTRRQCFRRLVGSVLMVSLAGLIGGYFLLEIRLERLLDMSAQFKAHGQDVPSLTEQDRDFVILGLGYVGLIALLLFGMLVLAFLELTAIRRFGMRHRKRIHEDRRAMLQRQLPLLRRSRNGNP